MNEKIYHSAIRCIDGWVVFCDEPIFKLAQKIDFIHQKGETMMTVTDTSGSTVSINTRNIVRIYEQATVTDVV